MPRSLKAFAQRYAAVFGTTPQPGELGGAPHFDVATGNTPIRFTTAAGLAQLLPGSPRDGATAALLRGAVLPHCQRRCDA